MLGAAALLALAYLARAVVDIVGPVAQPIPQGPVDVRIGDRLTIPVEGEFQRMSMDVVTSALLLALAAVNLTALTIVRRSADRPPRPLLRFLAIGAAGAVVLALDELLGLHETVGHNLPFLARLPGVEHADDVVFALVPLAAAAFLIAFRGVLLASRGARRLFALGVGLALVAAAIDMANPNGYEEPVELFAVLCLLAGFATLAVEQAAAAIRAERAPERARTGDRAAEGTAGGSPAPVPISTD